MKIYSICPTNICNVNSNQNKKRSVPQNVGLDRDVFQIRFKSKLGAVPDALYDTAPDSFKFVANEIKKLFSGVEIPTGVVISGKAAEAKNQMISVLKCMFDGGRTRELSYSKDVPEAFFSALTSRGEDTLAHFNRTGDQNILLISNLDDVMTSDFNRFFDLVGNFADKYKLSIVGTTEKYPTFLGDKARAFFKENVFSLDEPLNPRPVEIKPANQDLGMRMAAAIDARTISKRCDDAWRVLDTWSNF